MIYQDFPVARVRQGFELLDESGCLHFSFPTDFD